MVKTGKIAPFVTHLQYIRQILERMVKTKILRPQQTYVMRIVQNKQLSQTRTLRPNTSLYNMYHRSTVTPFDEWIKQSYY